MQKVSDMIEVKENGLQDKFIEALKSETFKTKDLGNGTIEVINNPNITPV